MELLVAVIVVALFAGAAVAIVNSVLDLAGIGAQLKGIPLLGQHLDAIIVIVLVWALDMNLGDKKLRLDRGGAWDAAHAAMAPTAASAFPALLYEFVPRRAAGEQPLARPLNPEVAEWYAGACRWGGCHPPREPWVEWPSWLASAPN